MSAERLRDAATLLRSRALAKRDFDKAFGPRMIAAGVPVSDTQIDAEAFGVMWTPDLAVAIAQWLEWWAPGFGAGEEMDDSSIDDHALAIADAVLASAPNFRASWWVNPASRATCDVEMEDGDPCLLPEDHEGDHS